MSVASDYNDQLSWAKTRLLVSAFTGSKPGDIMRLPLIDTPNAVKVSDETFNKFKKWQVKES